MPAPTAAPPRRGRAPSPPVGAAEARALARMTRQIGAAETVVEQRARLMADLYRAGHSMDAIAAAAGLHRSAVQKSLRRYEQRHGADLVRGADRA